jgi:aconitate hydratase
MRDSFKTRQSLAVGGQSYEIFSLPALHGYDLGRLPFSLKILLENLLRTEDGVSVTREDIEALLKWDAKAAPSHEIAFTPARVIMQDFTGVPAVVDLAAMREAMTRLGGNPQEINPLAPAELVIDHSVQVDEYGGPDALRKNNTIEFARNGERYSFLRWGQTAFSNFKVVPPNTGIVHQVNIEHLARVVFAEGKNGSRRAYPDTLVGTDSHTTMVNGLGVLGWGVGGIEAEAAMLGQPVTMLIPQVIGFRLKGSLPAGTTATDLVLTITEMLRKKGVVDKFVEFFGDGLAGLPLADRATIANMAPEFGSTLRHLPHRRGDHSLPRAHRTRCRADRARRGVRQGAGPVAHQRHARSRLHGRPRTRPRQRRAEPGGPQASAGPRAAARLQGDLSQASRQDGRGAGAEKSGCDGQGHGHHGWQDLRGRRRRRADCRDHELHQHLESRRAGRAGLLARNARRHGLVSKPWVKTSLAPRLAGGHRLSQGRQPAGRTRGRRLLPGGLRLHHLHRQFRPAAPRRFPRP